MNTPNPIECSYSEYQATLERLRQQGRRAVNITVTQSGYRITATHVRPEQPDFDLPQFKTDTHHE